MKRILIGALVGGLIVFAWGAFSHMLTPLGLMGLSVIPPANEAGALAALRAAVPEDGLYFIPGADLSKDPTPEEEKAWLEKYHAGPAGLLLIRYPGPDAEPMGLGRLGGEVLSDILAAFLLAWVLAQVPGSFKTRVLVAVAMGVFGWLTVSVQLWNWYDFPTSFTLGEGIDQALGWLLAGLAIAKIVPAPGSA